VYSEYGEHLNLITSNQSLEPLPLCSLSTLEYSEMVDIVELSSTTCSSLTEPLWVELNTITVLT
jgi:hypothetical protein